MIRANRPRSEINRRIQAINSSRETSFRGLLREGEYDLANDLRYKNFSGLSFAGEDLRGIDFTGANLVDCDFTGARIEGARFDRARLGTAGDGWARYSRIESASDWSQFCTGWVRSEKDVSWGDDHLPPGAIFMDSPKLPLMVRMPPTPLVGDVTAKPIAISYRHASKMDISFANIISKKDKRVTGDLVEMNRPAPLYPDEAIDYLNWTLENSGVIYRLISKAEHMHFCGYPNGSIGSGLNIAINRQGIESEGVMEFGDWYSHQNQILVAATTHPSPAEGGYGTAGSFALLRIVRELRMTRTNSL